LSKLYDKEYYRTGQESHSARWAGSGDYIADESRLLKAFDEHMADAERYHRPGRLLELGCAAGFLLEAARRRGWSVTGLDISDFATQHARERFGLDARVQTVAAARFDPGAFDVIAAFEYIEHVEDPVSTLRAIRPWLRSDGLLVLTTPNAGGWQARRHPDRFIGFQESTHLAYFTPATMRRLLRDTGFTPVAIISDMTLISAKGLAERGVARADQLRAFINRVAPGLKTGLRRLAGQLFGGTGMKVYAKPMDAGQAGK
jgi:2-polyprenyl-3-methyl-5-hydroxy-6-metoxy-1,4-benzoquinol methylase